MRTESPPEPWTPEADDETFVRLIGELIVAGLARGNELPELTLSVANVVVEDTSRDEEDHVPRGEYVAFSVRGGGDWTPERTWQPEAGATPSPFVSRDLEWAAELAGARFGYTRAIAEGGAVVVWFRRAQDEADARPAGSQKE